MRKTEEERKAANRERQRRWRAEHSWLGEQRRLKTYGMSKAHKDEGFDTNNTNVTTIEVMVPDSGKVERIKVDGRTRMGRVLLALWRQANGTTNNEQGPVSERPAGDVNPGVEVEGF